MAHTLTPASTLNHCRCQRCGASFREAGLTRSHAPRKKIAPIYGKKWELHLEIYILCIRCHLVYTQLEEQIIREACERMKTKHKEYIEQAINDPEGEYPAKPHSLEPFLL